MSLRTSVVTIIFGCFFILVNVFRRFLRTRVAIIVVGDVGRSPRMQYQALSVAKAYPDALILLIGLEGMQW